MKKKIFTENDFANFDKDILVELKKEKNSSKKKMEFITPLHTEIVNLFNEYQDKPERLEKGFHTVVIYKRAVLKSLANACIRRREELISQYKLLQGETDKDDNPAETDMGNKTSTEADKDGNT